MIESIGEKICLASHIEEQLRACEDENEKAELKQILNKTLYLRRKEMSDLLELGEKPDPKYHCQFKHALSSFMKDVEIYEATLTQSDLERSIESANLFAMVCSKYLGMEFEVCSRCLHEKFLLMEYEQKHESDTIEMNSGENENAIQGQGESETVLSRTIFTA